jgi:hypothetical protein
VLLVEVVFEQDEGADSLLLNELFSAFEDGNGCEFFSGRSGMVNGEARMSEFRQAGADFERASSEDSALPEDSQHFLIHSNKISN